ncbi:valine--tRNA ligase [Raoultibacter timonensis]|uniref:Valine--tRNA ligase n=1 Tax=Raoultibacter timonensis TaxID=1907662 RepID=A0ABM7WJQ5_9ACTN|nr:valine--tRNA ligase [Raoultibacter timonensis]BDE96577.1 valine--tRNA ligase [Raoultibacter timonensis]BDF51180.1 valine--tRNA ligase [Raoultibacter timonensis]
MSEEKNNEQAKKKVDYDFAAHERPLIEAWQNNGYFKRTPGFGRHADDTYTIVIPPPNITGALHMGHALNDTIQDTCIRRARMQGYRTRWVLGTDHAGIATQTKVDKKLADEGISRLEIGREAFVEACYDWYREYGATIVNQIKGMGCSCDYSDEHFTLEPAYVKAVRQVFVDWYHNDLIYRGKRIVNWCPSCTTAIADDEAEYVDEAGHLWYLRYPLTEPVDGMDYIVVATTRPETMLGDTGVAVSPKDASKKSLVGKTVKLPIVDREIPIFSDFHVDPEFGTGFVKVTPAHDPNDYAMGERNGLERINIFDEHAVVVEGYGEFSGMTRDEAREAVVARFEELGLLDHVEDHDHSVMTCYRCHTKLEPWLSEQWFVAVDGLKGEAARVVEDGSVTFYPERWKQVYLDWMGNLKDWCISRQLWWGHRIPMFYCDECGWEDASVEDVEVCPVCGARVRQDDDVLDTWFSSQLWPFATMGWPDEGMEAPEIKLAYPTQVLSTARDIMGLWVARMVMASTYFCKEIPFSDVIIHPTVMAADGKPMSKSRGNGVDPLRLMEDYGADGMRFGLLMQVTGAQDLKFNEAKLESSRNFANKIRNAARFVMMNLDGYVPGDPEPVTPADKWIFSRLAGLVARIDEAFEAYEFGEITRELYSFFWNEFCDWYIEFSKSRLGGSADDRAACQRNLVFVLDTALRLLHPIMPFVTEEIYRDLPVDKTDAPYLIVASWPDSAALAHYVDADAERAIQMVTEAVSGIRSTRSRYGISPKTELSVAVKADAHDVELLEAQRRLLIDMANLGELTIAADAVKPAESSIALAAGLEVYIVLSGLVDFEAERVRLEKERAKVSADAAKLEKKLSNPGFLAKAAPEIVEKDRAKCAELTDMLARIEEQLAEIG